MGAYASVRHEVEARKDIGGDDYSEYTFCLAGPQGDGARNLLSPNAEMIWEVEAESHFEAMTAYYELMGWGEYTTDQPWDLKPYPEEWFQR